MKSSNPYTLKMLRVDLSRNQVQTEEIDADIKKVELEIMEMLREVTE